ncbi:hypothetical protein KC325_g268 [Hortaea werneckii]|nr:hypothetical protein KC325_g268 [Hortaea werneckii]
MILPSSPSPAWSAGNATWKKKKRERENKRECAFIQCILPPKDKPCLSALFPSSSKGKMENKERKSNSPALRRKRQ